MIQIKDMSLLNLRFTKNNALYSETTRVSSFNFPSFKHMSTIGDTEYRNTNVEINSSAHDALKKNICQVEIFQSQLIHLLL